MKRILITIFLIALNINFGYCRQENKVIVHKKALLFGINNYKNIKNELNSDLDIKNIGKILNAKYRFEESELLNDSVTRDGILDSIYKAVIQAQPGDTVWIHFSGTGLRDNQGNVALLTSEVTKEAVESFEKSGKMGPGIILTSDIQKILDKAPSTVRIILVLDTCYSGGFVVKKPGLVMLAACEPTELGRELPGKGGAFSFALVETLDKISGRVSLAELMRGVRTNLESRRVNQHPVVSGDLDTFSLTPVESEPDPTARLAVLYQQLAEAQKTGDRFAEASILCNIGVVYSSLGENERALDVYNKSLPIVVSIGDKSGESGILVNIGIVYHNLSKYDKALELYNQALRIQQNLGDRRSQAITLKNMGVVYGRLRMAGEANRVSEQALSIYREIGDEDGVENVKKLIDAIKIQNDDVKNSLVSGFFGSSKKRIKPSYSISAPWKRGPIQILYRSDLLSKNTEVHKLLESMERDGRIRLIENSSDADLIIDLRSKSLRLVFAPTSANTLLLAVDAPGYLDTLRETLEGEARRRFFLQVENTPVLGNLKVELRAIPVTVKPTDATKPAGPGNAGFVATLAPSSDPTQLSVPVGTWVAIEVRNTGKEAVNFNVLYMDSGGTISNLYPVPGFQSDTLQPGSDWQMLKVAGSPLVFRLAPPIGRDAIKVIATSVRLGQIDLGAVLDTTRVSRVNSAVSLPLGKLQQRVAVGGRDPIPTVPLDNWATSTFWLDIQAKPR